MRTHVCGKLIEYAVDIFEAVGAAVSLGELDRFVDYYSVRHIGLILEFVRRNHQDCALHRT